MAERLELNFLLLEGEHGWSARCLEYDFVTQAGIPLFAVPLDFG